MTQLRTPPVGNSAPSPNGAAPTQPSGIQAFLGRHGLFWISGAVIAILVVGFLWFLFQPSGKNGSPGILSVGQAAPNFTLTDLNGKAVSLAQFKGHPVLINFWSTTCLPCRTETPLLEQTYNARQQDGLVILGVAQADPTDSVAKFGKDYALTYTLLPDTTQKVTKQYGVTGLPVSYFVDTTGVIRTAHNGFLMPVDLTNGLSSIGIKPQT